MSFDTRPPIDRLARGYVRDELRKLRKVVGDFNSPGSAFVRLHKHVQTQAGAQFIKRPRLSDQTVSRIRGDLHDFILKNFLPVAFHTLKRRIHGFQGRVSLVTEYFYIQPTKNRLVPHEGEIFEDEAVEFRFLRLVVDRDRVSIDDFSCFASFTTHALVRMIERDECEKEPIAYVASQLAPILACTAFLTAATVVLDNDSGVIIPLPKGMLVGKFMLAADDKSREFGYRRRIIGDADSLRIESLQDIDIIQGNNPDGILAIRVNTYLSRDMVSEDQSWCRDRMVRALANHVDLIPLVVGMITCPEVMADDKTLAGCTPLFDALEDVIVDPRWARACKLDRNYAM